MKFISTQQKLNHCLSIVEKIIGRHFALPILQNTRVFCSKETSSVTLCSTDLEMGVEVIASSKIETDGGITIPTKLFCNFVKNLPNENITFEENNKNIYLACADHTSIIKGESEDDFPIIPHSESDGGFTINASDFLSGLSAVVNSTSVLDIKPEITGVYIQPKEKEICFAATDSFRLSEKVIKITDKNSYFSSMILPKRICETLVRIFQGCNEMLEIQSANNQIIVKNKPEPPFSLKIRFVGRCIQGEYPNYEQIIPTKFSKSALIPKNDFLQKIRNAALFSNKISEVVIFLNSKKQKLEIQAHNQQYGDYTAETPCSVEGNDEKITLNYQYLLDGIQNISSPTIIMKANEATAPVLIEPQEKEGFLYLIMPIKT